MDTPRTCGQGLAENATLPAKLAELTAAVARILEIHRKALDLTDEASRNEDAAYAELAKKHVAVAAELQAISDRMAGSRDLPMGRHDPQAMRSQEAAEAFATFIEREEELQALLQRRLEAEREMLSVLRA